MASASPGRAGTYAPDSTLARAVDALLHRAQVIFARRPLVDPYAPESSDLDLVAVGAEQDGLPERLWVSAPGAGARATDVVWLSRSTFDDPGALAQLGLVAQRVLGSDTVYDPTGAGGRGRRALAERWYEPAVQRERIEGFLDMGFYTVREIGVTWDFPALALFWVHMAFAACVAAILDGAGKLCPNVYTRPFDYLEAAEDEIGGRIRDRMVRALRLDADPAGLPDRLRRIHEITSLHFPEPDWPETMRAMTRREYGYFRSPAELEWRIGVAGELARRGFRPAAVFYLRFWAYVLARLPMVHQRAREGVDVSFLRPARAVRPELQRLCPEILEPLAVILGGEDGTSPDTVGDALDLLAEVRRCTLRALAIRGLCFPDVKAWRPYEAPSGAVPALPATHNRLTRGGNGHGYAGTGV